MATEEGIIVRVDASGTWAQARRSGACESCASKRSCHSLGDGDGKEVNVLNPVGARPGDTVILQMDTAALLKASFLIYLFPILMLLLGAGLGEWISHALALDAFWPAAALGFSSLAAALIVMKAAADRLAKKERYRPRVLRIIARTKMPQALN